MKYLKRRPDFEIEIIRPIYTSTPLSYKNIIKFIPKKYIVGDQESNDIISYSFERSVGTYESSFSLSLTTKTDNDNLNWFSKLRKMDIVIIKEFGKPEYGGVITRKSFSSEIQSTGAPERAINIQGISIGNLLVRYPIILDQFLYESSTTAQTASRKLIDKLSSLQGGDNISISPILREIYNSYFDLAQAIGNLGASQGVRAVIDDYISLDSDLSKDVVARYPMAFSLYQTGENNLWDLVSSFITPPINELFGIWNTEKNVYEIIYRQAPFEPDDWKRLQNNHLDLTTVSQYDLNSSDDEVYTFFMCLLPGSNISRNKAMVYDSGAGAVAQIDTEKWKTYGYRPLVVNLRFFDKTYETTFGAANLMKELSEMLRRWYQKNDEFLSGTITHSTVNEGLYENARNPRIGEKLSFLNGEFYIEKERHSWSMLGKMETILTITRGYVYSKDGEMLRAIDSFSDRGV